MSLVARKQDDGDADGASGAHRSRSPVPGELLGGKYRVESLLAEGGMGLVLRATHLELDCPVAIKLIRPEYVGNEEVVARLLTEARIAAGLRSKHVNRVLDVGRTAHGAPYLVLELMEGHDLRHQLQHRGPLSVTEAADYVMQTCEALAEAHAFGIVHRDLKPENLFLSEEADGSFVLKVLDFGISKAPAHRRAGRSLTNPFEVVGSPNYMAPEQIRGDQVDARSDIWSLGAVLYELCSGCPPFSAESITETFALIVDESYELPPLELGPDSEHLHLVIQRCLRRDPKERFQDVTDLADALASLGSDSLQGRRVAKVAFATRARAQAGAIAQRATPLALSTSVVPPAPATERLPRPHRSKLSWLLAAAALASLGGVLWRWNAEATRVVPSPVRAAAAAVPPVVAAPVTTHRPADVAIAELATPASSASPELTRSRSPIMATPRPRAFPVRARVKVTTPPPLPQSEPPPAAPAARADAWDPDTFGGRR